MCGIAGVFNRNKRPVKADKILSMTRTLAHRGPDEEGFFINTIGNSDNKIIRNLPCSCKCNGYGNVGLGHRRLSIIDLKSGRQPLSNENKTIWVSFNGEIYNFNELKRCLESKGHIFATNSDTETIVHAYEEWGADAVKKFRGMFAIALWDQNLNKMLLFRDRLGKKPLYYFIESDRIIFASEIKAILAACECPLDINIEALSDYFSLLYIPAPKTIYTNVHKLPAAHYAIITEDSFSIHEYWDIDFTPSAKQSTRKYCNELLEILHQATKLRMISDVPLGAFLSGGVDSSAIVAMMSDIADHPVVTNSIGFNQSDYDESIYAHRVSKLFNTDHHKYTVKPEAVTAIEQLSWFYDEPFADSSAIPSYYVSQCAKKKVKVCLSGDGGDENFAGYKRYYYDKRENWIRSLIPSAFRTSFFRFLSSSYPASEILAPYLVGKALMKNVARSPIEAYYFTMCQFHDDEKKILFNQDALHELHGYTSFDLFNDLYNNAPAQDHLSKLQYLDIKTYLCDDILTKVDRASMAVSLEVRCPLLDHVFMEYIARIPSELKLKGKQGKYIFKKALLELLPADILYRRKMGFGMPVLEWLRNDLRDYASALILEGEGTKCFLNRGYLESILKSHIRGEKNFSYCLWSIMIFNLWFRKFGK